MGQNIHRNPLQFDKQTTPGYGNVYIIRLNFFLISFSAFAGPLFFEQMNYTVNNSTTITAFDATNCMTSSLLAVVIGYMFVKISQN